MNKGDCSNLPPLPHYLVRREAIQDMEQYDFGKRHVGHGSTRMKGPCKAENCLGSRRRLVSQDLKLGHHLGCIALACRWHPSSAWPLIVRTKEQLQEIRSRSLDDGVPLDGYFFQSSKDRSVMFVEEGTASSLIFKVSFIHLDRLPNPLCKIGLIKCLLSTCTCMILL